MGVALRPAVHRRAPVGTTRADHDRKPARWADRAVMTVWAVAMALLAVMVWPTTLGGRLSLTIVTGSSMEPTYHTGDLALVRRTDDIAPGDVIVYEVPAGQPGEGRHVIHRVTGGDATSGYVTQGDNRDTPDLWRPHPADVVGVVRAIVPQGGTWALRALSPIGLGVAAAVLVAWALWPRAGEDDDAGEPPAGAGPMPQR